MLNESQFTQPQLPGMNRRWANRSMNRPRVQDVVASPAGTYWHATNQPDFEPKPGLKMTNVNRHENPGLFLTDKPGHWRDIYTDERPYIAVVSHGGLTHDDLSKAGRGPWGDGPDEHEIVVHQRALGKVKVERVIPHRISRSPGEQLKPWSYSPEQVAKDRASGAYKPTRRNARQPKLFNDRRYNPRRDLLIEQGRTNFFG